MIHTKRLGFTLLTTLIFLQFAAAAQAQAPPFLQRRKSDAEREFMRLITLPDAQEFSTKSRSPAAETRPWIDVLSSSQPWIDVLSGPRSQASQAFEKRSGGSNPLRDVLSRRPRIDIDDVSTLDLGSSRFRSRASSTNTKRQPRGFSHEVISPFYRPRTSRR